MRATPAIVGVALATLLLGASAGCGNTSSERDAPPAIELKRITSAAQTVTPANALLPDAAERELISLAHDSVLAECVAKRGMTLALAGDEPMAWVSSLTSPYGGGNTFFPLDPDRMARYGYHDPRDREISRPRVTWDGELTPPDAVRDCDEEVTARLGGAPPFDMVRLIDDAGARAGTDPRREGPRRAWITCMEAAGYSYTQVGAPWAEFTQRAAEVASQEEIAVAIADAACQAQSRSMDTLIALIVAYQKDALADNAESVAAYRKYLDEVIKRATDIVNEVPAPANRHVEDDRS